MQILIFTLENRLLDFRIKRFLRLRVKILGFEGWKIPKVEGLFLKEYNSLCELHKRLCQIGDLEHLLKSSDNGLEATPVPIPNTKVKL